MKVFTITLNPVYDIFYRVPGFVPYEENQASSVSLYTGGKGVNVTRALLTSGYDTTAYLLLGHENCQPFLDGLTAEQIPTRLFYTEGRMRENVTLIDEEGKETRIIMNDFSANSETLDYILSMLKKDVAPDDVIACCGRFPNFRSPASFPHSASITGYSAPAMSVPKRRHGVQDAPSACLSESCWERIWMMRISLRSSEGIC